MLSLGRKTLCDLTQSQRCHPHRPAIMKSAEKWKSVGCGRLCGVADVTQCSLMEGDVGALLKPPLCCRGWVQVFIHSQTTDSGHMSLVKQELESVCAALICHASAEGNRSNTVLSWSCSHVQRPGQSVSPEILF